MKTLIFLAAALAIAGTLATCASAKAGPLEDFIATLPAEVQREPAAIRAALKRPVVTVATNTVPRVRSANQRALVQAVVPALATRESFRDAADKDAFLDGLIVAKLDGTPAPTAGEQRRIIKIQALRMAILREGLETAGDEADGQNQRVTIVEGPPRWRALGLPALPTLAEIRGAQE